MDKPRPSLCISHASSHTTQFTDIDHQHIQRANRTYPLTCLAECSFCCIEPHRRVH